MIFNSDNSLFTVEHRKHSKCLNSNIFSISQKRLAHREFDGVVTTSRCEFCNGPLHVLPIILCEESLRCRPQMQVKALLWKSREILEDMDTTSSGLKSSETINSFLSAHILKACISDGMGVCLSLELVACAFRKAPSVLKGKYTFYGPIQVTSFFREGLAYWTQNEGKPHTTS